MRKLKSVHGALVWPGCTAEMQPCRISAGQAKYTVFNCFHPTTSSLEADRLAWKVGASQLVGSRSSALTPQLICQKLMQSAPGHGHLKQEHTKRRKTFSASLWHGKSMWLDFYCNGETAHYYGCIRWPHLAKKTHGQGCTHPLNLLSSCREPANCPQVSKQLSMKTVRGSWAELWNVWEREASGI